MTATAAHVPPDAQASQGYGAVFTRRWVVELILDLCGYTVEHNLTGLHAVEPSIGAGAFLEVMVERLLRSRELHAPGLPWSALESSLCAWDVQAHHVRECRRKAAALLADAGCPAAEADRLARRWIRAGDFLLVPRQARRADLVVGNPPYIRIEDLPPRLLGEYRAACPTMGGRADIYIGFFERGLDLLAPGGRLGFICADRWMRNQYGKRLREKIVTEGFSVDATLVMHDTPAFLEEVSAYPAITVLRRGAQRSAVLASATEEFGAEAAVEFRDWINESSRPAFSGRSVSGARVPVWHTTGDSWPEGSPATLAWLERLADECPLLEDQRTGTRVSIGVATGADAVYVTKDADAVEPERLLPLAMAADTASGHFSWTGRYLVNPWTDDGLVDLEDWPRLKVYLTAHEFAVRKRAVARKNPRSWYRTIDRVTLSLTRAPMLVLHDMKARIHPVLAPAGFYPHHNLYYVVSRDWDLEALGGLLLSEAVERQVAAYCVKMRGRTLRFQAQYLRRVRVPELTGIADDVLDELRTAFRERDRARATNASLRAYDIDSLPDCKRGDPPRCVPTAAGGRPRWPSR